MKKVFVAMSGGVDSSVAAALLKRGGFDVVGVYMKPWAPEGFRCPWKEDREDALRVAVELGIPFKTWDFSKEYKKHVADYMIREYKAGRTPNPDIMCNKEIKFGLFLNKALKEGADYIATGHYARTKNGKLLKAKDSNKDQTYFLYTLTEEQLNKTLFPIGEYTKPEIRRMAKRFKLSVADKADSQGVCFVGDFKMKDFLQKYIKPKKGKIMMGNGVIGEHDGVFYYTIGQRHGLGLSNGPFFVVDKDIKKNIIYVSKNYAENIQEKEVQLRDLTWVNGKISKDFDAFVKVRYRTNSLKAKILPKGKKADLKFMKSVKAIAPGQAAVIYKGQTVVGGGIIV